MNHEETNQKLPEVRQEQLPQKRTLARDQLAELSEEDLNKFYSFERELCHKERVRDKALEFQKKEILNQRNHALEISTFADEILNIPCKVEQDEIEGMLMSQALVLQEFVRVFLGRMDLDDSISGKTAFAKLALQAQSLGRKTLATLIEMKHPRRSNTFIKQQNNAQINVNSDKQTSEN